MNEDRSATDLARRNFLTTSASAAGLILLPASTLLADEKKKQGGGDEDVSTNEDLMREHGILKRVLLAYDEVIRRIRTGRDFPPDTLITGATIVRKFVEDYHEKLEEDHLFPRFR